MSDHGIIGGVIAFYLQRYLKTKDWYQRLVLWLPGANRWAHRAAACAISLATSLGIAYTIDGSAAAGWHLAITIPPLTTMLSAAWTAASMHTAKDWAVTYVVQQVLYDVSRRPTDMPNDGDIHPADAGAKRV